MPREFFYDAAHPNTSAPGLGYPGPEVSRRIDDGWTVWAFTDIHGMRDGLVRALRKAGLTDREGHWIAPRETALVGVGDYIDRGPDSAGVVEFLRSLAGEALAAGCRVVLARGNHEQMLIDILRGDPEWEVSWLANGGRQLLASYGLGDPPFDRPLGEEIRLAVPDLLEWLLATVPYVVWRDVLFVHCAPIEGRRTADLEDSDLQLWVGSPFLRGRGLSDDAFSGYLADGIRRVVVGHIPQNNGPSVTHGGKTLLLDANACALRRPDGPSVTSHVCLVRIDSAEDLAHSRYVLEDTTIA